MKIVSIIEARMTSSRLPGKVLLKAANKPMLYHLVSRLRHVKKIDEIVIATTINKEDDKIINFAKKNNIKFFRGSENNVLERVYCAATFFKADVIVQITGDCPIIDPIIVEQVLGIYLINKADYVGNAHVRSYPDGMDVQVFSFKSLKKCYSISSAPLEMEHVTLGLRRRPKIFKPIHIIAPKNLFWPSLGLTLDEKKDYIFLKKIIEYFTRTKNKNFSCHDVINLLKKNKKHWLKINQKVKRKGDT